ncbi:MAG: hypothetical protein AMXMBFR33_32450 [Candidatus Xenobia bacterium]
MRALLIVLLLVGLARATPEEQAVMEAIRTYERALLAARDRSELYPYLSADTVLRCQQGNRYVGELEMLRMLGDYFDKPDTRVTNLVVRSDQARVDLQAMLGKVMVLHHYTLKREGGAWKIVLPP